MPLFSNLAFLYNTSKNRVSPVQNLLLPPNVFPTRHQFLLHFFNFFLSGGKRLRQVAASELLGGGLLTGLLEGLGFKGCTAGLGFGGLRETVRV